MDNDDREPANWFFATTTAMLEDRTALATAGQSPRAKAIQLITCGRRPQAAIRDVAVVAEAATIIATRGTSQDKKSG